MSSNTFGKILSLTTWGESHGKEIGAVLDGVPPNIEIKESFIQNYLNQRRPGQSKYVTQRKEKDLIKIVSGLYKGKSTGTPISMVIKNSDTKGKDYEEIKNKFRPAHADYTYFKKYGIRDYRGGGRSSARETAMRVAAGAIARLILGRKVIITGAVTQLGKKKINKKRWDDRFISKNDFFCPDPEVIKDWENYLKKIRKSGSSCGALIEIKVTGMPIGLGEPIYGKLDADIASALMGINADCKNCPDLVPTLCFLASYAKGESYLENVNVLKHKECDRLSEMLKMMEAFGVKARYCEKDDALIIQGREPHRQSVDYNPPVDHRMVMVCYLFQRFNGGGNLSNAHCVDKSFPTFFETME